MDKKKPKQPKQRESLTPEEVLARAQRARWRFRALVRLVIQNIFWLEDIADQELGDDVKKNIILLTRRKEKKSLLSLQDKAILNKPAEYRTEEEKQHLSRIIGGLKCFRRYPAHVKSQLAAVTYFFYYGPGRTIVRQGDVSHSLYFVITGDVTVSQQSFDPVLNKTVKQDIAVMGPGSMFGEVALLHDIPRTATITSNTHVELLCLKKNNFEVILKATVQQQWQQVQDAMRSFTYFESWDEIAVRECCILSKMKMFFPDQTILGDGFGLPDYVYLILRGRARVIEHLLVATETRNGKKLYKLYVPPPLPEASSITTKSESVRTAKVEERKFIPTADEVDTTISAESQEANVGTSGFKEVPTRDSFKTDNKGVDELSKSSSTEIKKMQIRGSLDGSAAVNQTESAIAVNTTVNKPSKPPLRTSINIILPPNVETHFMQVCFFNPTACFGIGENMSHRRVVATKPTECLLIPRYWLIQKNKGNIWNRVQQFLNSHIPTTKQVFKEFVNHRKWLAHRKKLVDEILSKRRIPNDNSLANVPYFIRINEEIDLN